MPALQKWDGQEEGGEEERLGLGGQGDIWLLFDLVHTKLGIKC